MDISNQRSKAKIRQEVIVDTSNSCERREIDKFSFEELQYSLCYFGGLVPRKLTGVLLGFRLSLTELLLNLLPNLLIIRRMVSSAGT